MAKPKQKPVTMWAILNPYSENVNKHTIATSRNKCWLYAEGIIGWPIVKLKELGYRAVKGKFTWSDK